MHIATNNKATLVETKVAIVSMYQNGTPANLSPQAQKAAHALAQYIHKHKTRQKFAFVLGKDLQDQHLLLLTIANHPATPKIDVSLQKVINQVSTSTQKQEDLSSVKQLSWVTKALHKVEFGILFWIYQHRLSGQEALPGTSNVPPPITAVNFQRVKTPHEQLQDQAWAKIIQVVHDLTSSQLEIRANAQQLPSQTKITASHIMLAIQKLITNDDAFSKVAQKLMKIDNIKVQLVDETGIVRITIKNYGNDRIINILGFKATGTPLAIAQAKIDHAQTGATPPTKLNQVLHGQAPMAADVNVPIKAGVTFTFQAATTVNDNGEADVTYIVDVASAIKGTTPKELTFTVGGFETQAEVLNKANARIQAVTTETVAAPTMKNKTHHGVKPASNDINTPSQTGFSFSFQEASAINDKGKTEVTYIVDVVPTIRGTTPKELTFTVGGFETQAEVLNKANARIQAVTTTTATLPTMKNKVHHGLKPTTNDINLPSQTGFSFSFQEASAINDKGEAVVTYIVDVVPAIKGTTPKDLTFTIGGFETKVDADARDNINKANARIQALIHAVYRRTSDITMPTKKRVVKQGQVPHASDLNPPVKVGFSFTFKSATVVADDKGANVTYRVDVMPAIKGTTPQDWTLQMRGFETKVDASARDNINRANARIQALIQAVQHGTSDVTPPGKIEGTVIRKGSTPLGLLIYPPVKEGFSFSFKKATTINDKWETKVTYRVDVMPAIKGTTPKDLSFNVRLS